MTRGSELRLSVTRDGRQSGADGRYESLVPRDESGEQRLLSALLFQIIGRNVVVLYCTYCISTAYRINSIPRRALPRPVRS